MNVLDKVSVEVTKAHYNNDSDDDDDDEEKEVFCYGAFLDVEAIIFYEKSKKIGTISATLLNRQVIPEGCFHETFDEHSGNMEWIGSALLENRYGRPKLQSLRDYDDPEFDFMWIKSFSVDDEEYAVNSDVAAAALYRFLHDPKYIKGELDYGCWSVSSAVYVLPYPPGMKESTESASRRKDRKRKRDELLLFGRTFTGPFLRNGFFQDEALIRKDPYTARLLVASYGDWSNPIRSASEAAAIKLVVSLPEKNASSCSEDSKILEAVEQLCRFNQDEVNFAAIMIGAERYVPPQDKTTPEQLATLRSNVVRLVQQGGSIARSAALHAACEHNKPEIAKLLLAMDGSSLNSKNSCEQTPLMVAAKNASGRLSINGIDDTLVIDLLLSTNADKSITDSVGMTAYGYFAKNSKPYADLVHRHCRGKLIALESKLCPPAGPTMMDLAGGNGGESGFVDYGPEDEQANREYGDSSDY